MQTQKHTNRPNVNLLLKEIESQQNKFPNDDQSQQEFFKSIYHKSKVTTIIIMLNNSIHQ